jgi:drug/metabolite transporter (DMT)-like permease
MSTRKAELLLALIVLATSSSYLFTKLGTADMGPFTLVALRFAIAFVPLALVFFPRIRRANRLTVGIAALLAFLFFVLLATQAVGLATVTTTEGAFLSSTTVVWVPVMTAILTRKLPSRFVVGGCALVMVGIAVLLGIQGVGFTDGAILFLISAVVYGVHIIIVDRMGKRIDAVAMGALEMGFAAIPAALCAFAFETPALPTSTMAWVNVLALGLVCSAFAIGLQPEVQCYTSPERYGVLFGLGPAFSAILGIVFLGEPVTVNVLAGSALILAGVFLVILFDSKGESEGERVSEKATEAVAQRADLEKLAWQDSSEENASCANRSACLEL